MSHGMSRVTKDLTGRTYQLSCIGGWKLGMFKVEVIRFFWEINTNFMEIGITIKGLWACM